MSKKKDHLFVPLDLVRSVLFEIPATSACGESKVFTREYLDVTDYNDGCKDCYAVAADASKPKPMTILVKAGWTALLEEVWKDQYRENNAVKFRSYTPTYSGGAYSYTFTMKPWKDGNSKGGTK